MPAVYQITADGSEQIASVVKRMAKSPLSTAPRRDGGCGLGKEVCEVWNVGL